MANLSQICPASPTDPADYIELSTFVCMIEVFLIINRDIYFFPIVCLIFGVYLKLAFLQFLSPLVEKASLDETSIVYQTNLTKPLRRNCCCY
jgi:hypothetical protein